MDNIPFILYFTFKRKCPRFICLICLEPSNYEVMIYIMKYFLAFHDKITAASIIKKKKEEALVDYVFFFNDCIFQ